MKTILILITLCLSIILATTNGFAKVTVQVVPGVYKGDLNLDGEVNALDFASLIGQIEKPEEYRIWGELITKVSQEMPPFVSATRHCFADARLLNSDPNNTPERLQIRKEKIWFKDVYVDEVNIWWVREVENGLYYDVFLTFGLSVEENLEIEDVAIALLSPAFWENGDLDNNGALTSEDVRILSELIPLPKGADNELAVELLSPQRPTLENPGIFGTAKKTRLATTWGKIKGTR